MPEQKNIGTSKAIGTPRISFKHHPLRHCLAKTFRLYVAHCMYSTQVSVQLWVVHDHCTLYSMPSLEAEYCSHQYSILCSACRCLCVPPASFAKCKHKPCASRSVGNYGRQLQISISSHVSQTEYQNPQKPANRTKLTLSLLQVKLLMRREQTETITVEREDNVKLTKQSTCNNLLERER